MTTIKERELPTEELERVTIRFAGDSGDGMQVTGTQFTRTSAVFGNDVSTLPDFPAEIRAPAGSLPGVSGFQISFSSTDIHTPGDQPDVLVAMNPAALKVNLGELPPGGALIVNSDAFDERAPGLAASVLARELLLPADLETRYGLTGGDPFQGELALDQLLFLRPVPGWANHRTPIPGLYLCGPGTHPAGAITGAAGRHAANAVLADREATT